MRGFHLALDLIMAAGIALLWYDYYVLGSGIIILVHVVNTHIEYIEVSSDTLEEDDDDSVS